MSRNNRRGAGHKKPAPSDRRMTPHHDREVRYWTPGEDDDVPFGFHETNLAPWEQPYALEDDKEQE